MTEPTLDATTEPADAAPSPVSATEDAELVLDDLIVEDVSIDGMCGVY